MQDTVINYAFLCSCLQLSSRSCFRFADNLNSICSVISMDDGTVDKSTQEPKINCGCFHFKNDEYECFVAYSRCSPFASIQLVQLAITQPEIVGLPSAKFFAECILSGTRQISYLPSANTKTLGKLFAERINTRQSSALSKRGKKHSAKANTRQRTTFCRVS